MLLFRFTHVDRTEPEREFSIVLDVSSRTYRGVSRSYAGPVFAGELSEGAPKVSHEKTDELGLTVLATSSTPLLGTLPTLMEELNETRQFYVFVRQLREAFRVQVEEEKRYKGI